MKLNPRTGQMLPIDIFGGTKGLLSRKYSIRTVEGVLRGRRSVYVYPNNGPATSKAFGLCIEYTEGKPASARVTRRRGAAVLLKITMPHGP